MGTLEAQQRELDELRQAAGTFSDSLRLFDTADFYVAQDEGSQTNTELDYVIQYCQQYLTLKTSLWAELKEMQHFVREELSQPFIVQDSASEVVERAELMSERLLGIQRGLSEIRRRTEQYLEEGLTINQEANRVIEFADPVVFSLRQTNDTEDDENELESDEPAPGELASVAFSDLKLLIFVYKRVFRE